MLQVGAIVNTTSKDLNLEQGIVSASLLKAGGSSLQQECRSKYPQGINFGDFAVTTGGNMKCQIVLHGCLQQWRGDGAQKQVMYTYIDNHVHVPAWIKECIYYFRSCILNYVFNYNIRRHLSQSISLFWYGAVKSMFISH